MMLLPSWDLEELSDTPGDPGSQLSLGICISIRCVCLIPLLRSCRGPPFLLSGHFPAKLDESYCVASQKSAGREGKAQKNKGGLGVCLRGASSTMGLFTCSEFVFAAPIVLVIDPRNLFEMGVSGGAG